MVRQNDIKSKNRCKPAVTFLIIEELQYNSGQTWGQFNSGIGIDGQFQFQFRNWNWNCLFEQIIELELKFFELELELKFATKNLNPQIMYAI